MAKSTIIGRPHTLSDEHQKRVLESDKLRAANPLRVGPDAPKKNPSSATKEGET